MRCENQNVGYFLQINMLSYFKCNDKTHKNVKKFLLVFYYDVWDFKDTSL
jgi:hypothetical protein